MKFVIIEDKGCDLAVIFDEIISHDRFIDMKPKAAGFCSIESHGKICIWVKSVSLKLDCNPEFSMPIILESISRSLSCIPYTQK